jgi:hypothetical protein
MVARASPRPLAEGGSIDFVNGIVLDVDAGAVQTTFTPSSEVIGFAFSFDSTPGVAGGEGPGFSQVALTGGVDAVGSYPSLVDPPTSLIRLELDGTLFAIEVAQGVEPIPEPASPLLFCAGFLIVDGG